MASQAKFGKGTGLTRAGYALLEVIEVKLPTPKTKEIDVSNNDSPNNDMEFIPGLRDGDRVEVTCNFRADDTNGQIGLMTDQDNGTISAYILTLPPATGVALQFNGFVVSAMPDVNREKQIIFKAIIKVTGSVVFTRGASSNLTALVVANTTLVPTFAGATREYNGVVTPGTASVTVTPTNAAAATILVNGAVVASGAASTAIATAVGVTNVTVITQDSTKSPLVYVLHLGRAS